MRATPRRRPVLRIGLALDGERLWAVPLDRFGAPVRGAKYWTRSLDGLSAAELGVAFGALQEELHAASVVAHVALLPPVVQARRLELPRLRTDELRRVLARYAGKYFFGAREPQVVGVAVLPGRQRSPIRVFAAAAPTHVVAAILDAAKDLGWKIESVTSAYDAWAAAVHAAISTPRPGAAWVVVDRDEAVEALCIERGRPSNLRRVRAGASAPKRVAELVGSQPVAKHARSEHAERAEPVVLLGTQSRQQEIAAELDRLGVARLDIAAADFTDTPEALAAAHAARADGAEVLPERVHDERRRRARRLTAALSGVAAALVVLAAGLELWGAQRELDAVLDSRAAMRSEVNQAMALRDGLMNLNERLAILASLEATAPRWSGVMATVAEHLPGDAHILAFRARGDSLVLEGIADRAAGVFEAMQIAPGVVGVRAEAPIRRELRDGERPIERFTLAAQLSRESREEPEP